MRIYRCSDGQQTQIPVVDFKYIYLYYLCSNCRNSTKVFSLAASRHGSDTNSGLCYKFGEHPAYGPLTSSRLISLIGSDRDIFLKGRRCENQGLGVGAFAYYRRVVENQKGKIIGKIIAAAEQIHAPLETIDLLKQAQQETQFSKAVDLVRDAIPQSFLIDGHHNPLTLLHSALSGGLHDRTDEQCLEDAHDIRLILAALSDRIAQTLADDRELNEAVSRLLKKRERQIVKS